LESFVFDTRFFTAVNFWPQLPGVPRFDTSNVVLIEESGNPTGTRITAPVPNCIRPSLVKHSHPKRADYTKLLAIATKFV
jgi:large subunit ribosomal protein L14